MICPFCRKTEVANETDNVTCPACKAGFEIDDRGECVFAITEILRMPVHGQVSTECGLVQRGG